MRCSVIGASEFVLERVYGRSKEAELPRLDPGAVTATVIAISGVVVNTGVPQAATYDVDMAAR